MQLNKISESHFVLQMESQAYQREIPTTSDVVKIQVDQLLKPGSDHSTTALLSPSFSLPYNDQSLISPTTLQFPPSSPSNMSDSPLLERSYQRKAPVKAKLQGDTGVDGSSFNKQRERENRAQIVLYKRPFQTIYYFLREIPFLLSSLFFKLLRHKKSVLVVVLFCVICLLLDILDGPHAEHWAGVKKSVMWWSWWVALGFMSSCGFGTGLHTFVLYLGPFIAKVTLAAYECRTTDFPSPPYPEDIVCPNYDYLRQEITLWSVMQKVQVEAVLWGIGTAIGELPPYFVARAARLSGHDSDDEEMEEFEELLKAKENTPNNNAKEKKETAAKLPWTKRAELWVTDLIIRAGFVGIVLCASIPNPLFDLAGMTCGHFNVPFWTFFGATVIGKAFIKMHIQQLFVIAMFTEHHVETILSWMSHIPVYGAKLREPFLEYLAAQKEKLHQAIVTTNTGWFNWITGLITWLLIGFFVYSIINSLAQSYDRRICKWRHYVTRSNEKQK